MIQTERTGFAYKKRFRKHPQGRPMNEKMRLMKIPKMNGQKPDDDDGL